MITEEVWRDIPYYENIYQVSNFGRVKSLARKTEQNDKTRFIKTKILKQYVNKFGYKVVMLRKNNKRKEYKVHRLVLYGFRGLNDLIVNHLDGNKQNNKLENLEYCTYSENTIHYLMNREKPKIDFYKNKVIKDYLNGYSLKYIGRKYDYDKDTVKSLLKRNNIKIRLGQSKEKSEVEK
ncbi:NUMOD4 domain-containing protein [Mammaliicoccus vitulinus]|uniref:NUMOD4 domain-containing protein n=1 Tax=Mammaliicoccus vitulinus TaxID=71237 RepID=UPI0028D675D2|nr:NUMOD4 domain-containing protein [Mammaliicoccus vitulinus]